MGSFDTHVGAQGPLCQRNLRVQNENMVSKR